MIYRKSSYRCWHRNFILRFVQFKNSLWFAHLHSSHTRRIVNGQVSVQFSFQKWVVPMHVVVVQLYKQFCYHSPIDRKTLADLSYDKWAKKLLDVAYDLSLLLQCKSLHNARFVCQLSKWYFLGIKPVKVHFSANYFLSTMEQCHKKWWCCCRFDSFITLKSFWKRCFMKYPFASILTFMKYDAIIAYLNYSSIKSQPFT